MHKNRISDLLATQETIDAFRRYFTCRRCGTCCRMFDGVKVTKAEMKRLDVPRDEWGETFIVMGDTYYMKEPCRFYSDSKPGCTIYNERPETCKHFPMHTLKRDDGLIHLGISEICPAAIEALAEVEVEFMGR